MSINNDQTKENIKDDITKIVNSCNDELLKYIMNMLIKNNVTII